MNDLRIAEILAEHKACRSPREIAAVRAVLWEFSAEAIEATRVALAATAGEITS